MADPIGNVHDFNAERLARKNKTEAAADDSYLKGGGGGGTSGGMDAWQQSVESRLKSLDDRLGRVEPDIATLKTDIAVLKATAATKSDLHALELSIGTKMQKYLAIAAGAVTLLTVFGSWATKFLH